jgi:hypothetical protein
VGNLGLEMIGAKYRFIAGYKGSAKIIPAFRRNEVQATHTGHPGYHMHYRDTMIKEGKVIASWYHPDFDINGNPQIGTKAFPSSVKSFIEVYKDVHGKMPSGVLWDAYKWFMTVVCQMSLANFAPPGTPKEAVAELRKSYQAAINDPAYLKAFEVRFGAPLRYANLNQGIEVLKTYRNVSPEVLAALEKMAKIGSSRK